VERGVIAGVVLSLAVHVWREMRLDLVASLEDDVLHIRLHGVLDFASAPVLDARIMALLAGHPHVTRVVLHLHGLGRVDLTGTLVLRALLDQARSSGTEVELRGVPSHSRERVRQVLGPQCRAHGRLHTPAPSGGVVGGRGP
ncbi:MAG: STAS domain-containing protein, partial [Dehalococcoidia bacterium]